MKSKRFVLYSKILSFFLLLLGFSSCGPESEPRVEYGTPSAKYKVSGKVVSSKEQKNPIENIRVVMIEHNNSGYQRGDTVYTDSSGKFELNKDDFPHEKFKIKFQDIDGIENGYFEDMEQIIEFKNSDYKGGKRWYEGEAKKNMGTIEMNPK